MFKQNKQAFTLIELLVVVLIIGILAAIALPQYQKAVKRARMAEVVQALGDWADAQQIFYMQRGEFAADVDDLNARGDIKISLPSTTEWDFSSTVFPTRADLKAVPRQKVTSSDALSISVIFSGNHGDGISKICGACGARTTSFCDMAKTFGYKITNASREPCAGDYYL